MLIDKVKEILGDLEYTEYNESGNKFIDAALDIKQVNETAKQICQLSPKSPDNPEGYEGRLLTDDGELRRRISRVLHKAIRQFEIEEYPEAFDLSVHIDQIIANTQANYRERIEGILQIFTDWDKWSVEEGGEKKFQKKYGRDTASILDVVEQALKEELNG